MNQSQIARLVLGYLKEECLDASAIFAASYSHLLEFRIQTFRNENPSTNVTNMTLNNFFQEYRAVFFYVKTKLQDIKGLQSECNPKDLVQHLETIIDTMSGIDSDQNDITIFYDSRVSNVEIAKNKNTEDEKSIQARLVLGFLLDEFPDAAVSFAATSFHLAKYRLEKFAKKESIITLNGMTLVDILQQYYFILTYIQKKLKELGSQTICIPGELLKNLETIICLIGKKLNENKSKKRRRTLKDGNVKVEANLKLTENQKNRLNEVFQICNYIRSAQRKELSRELGLTEMQVKHWFQKKRDDEKDRSKIQNTTRQNYVDSSVMMSNPTPGPSTFRAVNENEINICSSSSNAQHEKRLKSENPFQE